MASFIGKIVDERYKIISFIGRGGFGTVWKVEHVKLNKYFALKSLHKEYLEDKKLVKRFEREAKAACRIGHKNIIDIIDFGEDPELGYYFVMEFLEGETLSKRIDKEGQLKPEDFLHIMLQVTHALAATHRAEIIHRDLKPDNIILLSDAHSGDFVKILDFGIVEVLDEESGQSLSKTSSILGTPAYMAPEQAQGEKGDRRSDIYSLGVIMYHMITGDVPFNAANPLGLLMKHITEPPVQPSQVNPEIKKNPDFEMIIMKCLEKEPDKRFQTMDELYANFIRVHQQLSNQGTERLKALPYAPSLTRYHRTIIRKKYFAVSMWSIAAILLISLIAVIIMKIIHNEPSENVVQQLQTVLTDAIIDSHEVFQAKTSMISPLSQEMIKEAVLLVNSTPDDADVYFPEEKVSRGKTPVSLKIRSNEIPQFLIITKKGYQKKVFATEKIKNSLAAGENVELKINLEKTTSQKKKVNSLEGWKP